MSHFLNLFTTFLILFFFFRKDIDSMFCSPEGKKTKINNFENTSKNTNNHHQNKGFEIFNDSGKNSKNSKQQNKEKEFEIFSDIKEKNHREINSNQNLYSNNKTINLDISTNNDNNIRKNSFDSVLSDNFQFCGEHTNTLGFGSELSVIREVKYLFSVSSFLSFTLLM